MKTRYALLISLLFCGSIPAMEQQSDKPVIPATAAAIAAQDQKKRLPIELISKRQAPDEMKISSIIDGNAIEFSNFLRVQVPFEMRRQQVDSVSQLGPIEIDYEHNQVAFIAAILNFLPHALRRGVTTQYIAEEIIRIASHFRISFAESLDLIKFFDIPIALDALMSIWQSIPLPINQAEEINYNSRLAAVFKMAQSHNDNSLWQLFGRMLYPRCDKHPKVAEMIRFITAQKDIEQLVLGAYMQQHLEMYQHFIKEFRVPVNSFINIVLSPDGKTLTSGFFSDPIRLLNVVDGSLMVLRGYTGVVRMVAFSPDGKTLASASFDHTIRLWNPVDGKFLRELRGHTGVVKMVAFSPDGKTLASVSDDHTVRLWNLVDGVSRPLRGHTKRVNVVAFSPDGKTLASGSDDNTIRLWNAVDGTFLRELKGHTSFVSSVAFSPDGKILASGSYDSTIRLWNAVDGTFLRELKGHTSFVSSVAFSPDGKILASGSYDSTIRLWNALDGTFLRHLKGHTKEVTAVTFSPDGETFISKSPDNILLLWNLVDGTSRNLGGSADLASSFAFSPDSKTFISSSPDGTVRLWNLVDRSSMDLRGHTGSASSAVFSPDGRTIISGSYDNTIRLWGYLSLPDALRAPIGQITADALAPVSDESSAEQSAPARPASQR